MERLSNALSVETEMANSKRSSRVHFEDGVDDADDADLVHKKNKKSYWSKGERRYSEAEKAFLSRVRIRSVVGRDRQRKFGCLKFFDPAEDRVYLWLFVVSIAVLYNIWTIMLRTAFSQLNDDFLILWLVLDYSCDIIYVADIIISMRTGFLEEGIIQTSPRKLRNHYIKSLPFFLDAAATIPLDFLYIVIPYIPAVRINRIFKFHRFWHFLDRTESRTSFPSVVRLGSLVHFILIIIHWNACVYFMVSKELGFGTDNWVYPGLPGQLDKNSSYNSLSRQYIYSFYWSTLTLTTIGEVNPPNITVEYVIVTFDYLIGVLLFATIVGNVGNIITNLNASRLDFQNKMDGVKAYMRFHKIPQDLQNRVIKWFDYLWTYKKHPDEEEILLSLPDKLRAEIAINVHLDSLRKVAIFQDCESGFLCELVLRLRSQLFSPGDYVCRKGEVGREMYIVNRGKLEVVSERGTKIYAALEAGSYFGEISVLCMSSAGNRRTASVRSVGYTELFCLSKNDLTEVLNEYPAIKAKIEKIALEKLENDKRRISSKVMDGVNASTQGTSMQGRVIEEKEFKKLVEKVDKLESQNQELVTELQKQKSDYDERLVILETALSELLRKRTNEDSPSSLKASIESVWKKR